MKDSEQEDKVGSKSDPLILFRLKLVEDAVRDVSHKLDEKENITKADLSDFRDSLLSRFNDTRDDLQRQVNTKADQKQVDDLRTLIKSIGTIFGSIITALIIYYLTTGQKQ